MNSMKPNDKTPESWEAPSGINMGSFKKLIQHTPLWIELIKNYWIRKQKKAVIIELVEQPYAILIKKNNQTAAK